MSHPLFDEVWNVIVDYRLPSGAVLWPDDEPSKKRNFLKASFENGHITLLTDSQSRLAGFLIFVLKIKNVHCEFLWVRPDLRGTSVCRSLIKKALAENALAVYGADKAVFQNTHEPLKSIYRDFKRFNLRFS